MKAMRDEVDETAETLPAFLNRILSWWDEQIIDGLADASVKTPRQVLVVSHGGVISQLVKNLISSGRVKTEPEQVPGWTCFNVSVTTIEVMENKQARLVSYSDVSHLNAAELVQYNVDDLKTAGLLSG